MEMEILDLKNAFLMIGSTLSLVLAYLIIKVDFKRTSNLPYGLLAIGVGLWGFGLAGFQLAETTLAQIFWYQMFILALSLMASSFLHFSLIFSSRKDMPGIGTILLIYAPNLIIFWTLLSPNLPPEGILTIDQSQGSILNQSCLYLAIYLSIIWIWGAYNLLGSYAHLKAILRSPLKYSLVGATMAVMIGSLLDLGLLLGGNYDQLWLGPGSSFIFLSFTVYAVLRYRFIDIRVIARNFFIYTGLTAFIYGGFYLTAWIYQHQLGDIFSEQGLLAGLLIAPGFVATFYGLDRGLRYMADHHLFSSLYYYRSTINQLTGELNQYLELDKIIDLIVTSIKKTVHPDRIEVLLAKPDSSPTHYKIIGPDSQKEKNKTYLTQDDCLTQYLSENQKPLVREELTLLIENARTTSKQKRLISLKEQMDRIGACLCLPLITHNRLLGVMILGRKLSDEAYTSEDLKLLTSISLQASTAIANARLYKQTRFFNQTLQQTVDQQTEELKAKTKHLEKLLQMRSEFLDITSHQLRTPISVILGTISMFKEGSVSDLPEVERQKLLDGIYQKARKLEIIVRNILTASEIDSEAFQLAPHTLEPIDPAETTEKITTRLKEKADSHNVKLHFRSPRKKIAPILAHQYYLEQVLFNLIDNAINFSPGGTVTVSLQNQKGRVRLRIEDTGIGITELDQKRLFHKFSRGRNANDTHTDGSGLGLFIAKQIIDHHPGARINLKSQVGQGTTVSLSLPQAPQPTEPPEKKKRPAGRSEKQKQ